MDEKADIPEMNLNAEIKVSVVMPIYNACRYIRPALDSILSQTLSDIEVICVDDGSTDTSLDMLKIYQKNDSRIRIITETNAGPALARNNGLKRSRGEYVVFLDADDFYEIDLLEKLYTLALNNDLDIAIAGYDIYNNKKATFKENSESEQAKIYEGFVVTSKNEHPDEILQSTTGAAWNKLFKRSFLMEKGITFLEDTMMFEDVYFTVCAMAFAERVAKLPDVLVHHRIYNEQSRVRTFKKYYHQVPHVYLRIKEFLMKGGMYHPLAKGYLNLSASRCYHVYNLLDSKGKEKLFDLLHEEYTEALGWTEHVSDDFYKADVCEFCASVTMYTYAQYQKRISKGKELRAHKVDKTLMQNQKRKAFVNALKKIFGKKKV